ncbi:hypothetical protein COEREDRAFT_84808 [Coemansia reversa NRRL 1564]|uniref:Dynactin subunit 3 n=1 Tax=Coemansia reversa (strain ATCC 12441 / NRRL 1564) TaxID=763665 RepID=A0A2G5BIM8_COERN|nr:hypothetical protein COEREDRAFT_84808 [Coemansia reversa NRRL 1564]|eukprot:PIA18856.1 hypothetical protein COEREDRAFT_84808 [Coemansia reversa NRRL 1564]
MDALVTRVAALERCVCSVEDNTQVENLLGQVALIERQLGKTLSEHASLALGFEKYEKLRDVIDGDGDIELSRRMLGVDAKMELILLNSDFQKTLSSMRNIRDLQPRVNQPEYATAAALLPQLHKIELLHADQTSNFGQVVAEISSIVDRYHAETEALSEIFITWDRMLTTIERKVSALEAAKAADD